MSVLHLSSSVVLSVHSQQHAASTVSFLWRAIFFSGGFALMLTVGMLIMIRWDEHTRYARVDKVALAMSLVAIVVFAVICRSS
jgi:hypothetical protein